MFFQEKEFNQSFFFFWKIKKCTGWLTSIFHRNIVKFVICCIFLDVSSPFSERQFDDVDDDEVSF